jgi:hypothetical protein
LGVKRYNQRLSRLKVLENFYTGGELTMALTKYQETGELIKHPKLRQQVLRIVAFIAEADRVTIGLD